MPTIKSRPAVLNKLLDKCIKPLESLAESVPPLYLGLVTLIALWGYAAILFFPYLIYVGSSQMISLLFTTDTGAGETWQHVALWGVITLLSMLVTYSYFTTRFKLPAGIELNRDKAPALFDLLEELRETYKGTPRPRVIITDRFELNMVRTPRFIVPFWHTYTLKLGMPVLQCVSAEHLRCLLARKLGQFSRLQNPLPNWLYQLRHDWPAHTEAFARNPAFGVLPLTLFFRAYTPFYVLISAPAARLDELRADRAALRLINDEVTLETIEQWLIAEQFMHKAYWPNVKKIINRHPVIDLKPFDKLAKAYQLFESRQDIYAVVSQIFSRDPERDDPMPSLMARVENIGHTKLRQPTPIRLCAAHILLKPNYAKVVAVCNKLWSKQTGREWKQTAAELQDARAIFNALYLKSKKQKLSFREIWQYARLQRRLFGQRSSFPIQNLILRRTPRLLPAK